MQAFSNCYRRLSTIHLLIHVDSYLKIRRFMKQRKVNLSLDARHVLLSSELFATQLKLPNPICAADRLDKTVSVADCWLEMPLDPYWLLALRILLQRGEPIIAELRIFPRERLQHREPGEWSASLLGVHAKAPKGGIPVELVRNVPLGLAHRKMAAILEKYRESVPQL